MYIKNIEVEGFKSYAQKTMIGPFDAHFNAITGLNGSGKSNILDAICFVLGIANVNQIRATNIMELIYKTGNAGITKASVSISFDNTDKNQTPVGYKEYDEIVITRQINMTGKSKYLINGQNAQKERLSDLFCSVQLNVNNPNFLIMQGKITKVLNMKPVEVLSMIEEAAGTKTYDTKKENALQIIEKKNAKLNEIERVLKEDITPMIEKLKNERSAYNEYQAIERQYTHLHKKLMAYHYYTCEETLSKAQDDNNKFEKEIDKHKNRIVNIDDLVKKLKNEIKLIQQEKDDDGSLKTLEINFKEMQKDETKLNSELDNVNSIIKSEKKRKNEIDKMKNDNNDLIKTKDKKLNDLKKMNENTHNAYEEAERELKKAQELYEALCCGLSAGEDGTLATIQDQLINIRSKISEHETIIKQAELRRKHATDESNKMNKEMGASTKDYDEKLKNHEKLKQNFEKLKAEIEKLNYDPELLDKLNLDIRKLNNEIFSLNEKIQQFYIKFPQLNFEYKNPEANFDRRRVKGLVCNLFKVKDPKYATALEVAAGGKLYNLVVDTDKTGKLLLQNGDLKRKITIIPMNQIRSHVIDANVVKCAKDLVGGDNVFTALSLIEYEPQFKQVMEFVFGSRLICTTLDAAKQVAFNRQTSTNTITLDGDHIDPEGVLTGGSRQERACVILKLNELQNDINQLEAKKIELNNLNVKLEAVKSETSKYNSLKREYDKEMNQLNVAKSALEQNSHHQKLEKYKLLLNEIEEKKASIETSNQELKNLKQKQVELEEKLNNQDSTKEKDKKAAQEKIKQTKQFLDKNSKSSQQFQKEYETIKMEIEVLNKEISGYDDELTKIDENIEKQKEIIDDLKEKIDKIKEAEDEILGKINKCKELINQKNRNINAKSDECDNLNREKNSLELKIKELEHKKSNINEQVEAANEKLEELLEAHPWIKQEKTQFGLPNTEFDFSQINMKELQHRLHEMKNRKEKLSKQVDRRAMNLLTKKEEEYDTLKKKRDIVLKDKATLETTIQELEEIKINVLEKAFSQINKDLGSIFKTLLPGAYAKLEPCNKQSILGGVEFKVAFGDVWKESLTELSGGQRSLVALSLILSLLRYKPAPLYILDEVDAALDSSHTQNIGLMIKKHFRNSQFVIVSLKDGMFSNANVLFRTKLIDGMSTIQQFVQKKANKENQEDAN